MADQTKHIRELCDKKNIGYKELLELICTAIDNDGNKIDYPAEATVNRWLNQQVKKIDEKYIKYVAEALNVSEKEIRLGEPLNPEAEELERIKKQLELDENEKNQIARILYLERYYLRIFSLVFALYGLFLLNLTHWKNPIVFMLTVFLFALAMEFDKKKDLKETGRKKKSFKDDFREIAEVLKIISKKGLFNRVLLLMLVLMFAVFFLPFVESLFYKGTFYISSTVLLLVAVALFVESVIRR